MGRLRRQVGVLRALTILSLVLVVVLGVWSVVGILSLSAQLSSLEAKVDVLNARLAAQSEEPSTGTQSVPQAETSSDSSDAAPAPSTDDVDAPAGAGVGGAIVVGDPKATKIVEVYVDYQCPYCQRWETEIGAALMGKALQPDSGLAVRQYNMAFLGEKNRSLSPPGASARAASAASCVLDVDGVDSFVDFNTAIFAAPGGGDAATRFDTASLIALAAGIGASDTAVACIEGGGYMSFVAATTQMAFSRGVTGTPTVLIDGKPLKDPFGDEALLALLGS